MEKERNHKWWKFNKFGKLIVGTGTLFQSIFAFANIGEVFRQKFLSVKKSSLRYRDLLEYFFDVFPPKITLDKANFHIIKYRYNIPHIGKAMKNSKDFITSLSRGLSLLSALAESPTPLNLTELSRVLRLRTSTVQRMTYTLKQLGYLDRDEDTKKFRTGPKTLSMGLSVIRNLNLRKVAFPYLEKTSKEIGETVNLAILDGTEIVYVERIKTQQILNINLEIGSRLPAFCTSMGKAMLAYLPEDRLEELLNRTNLIPLTSNTITHREAIRKELERVGRRGFATNNEELAIGLRSVAAPVRNFRGEVIAAVNIAVPSIRVSQKKLETVLARRAMETAHQISSSLGYKEAKEGQISRKGQSF